MQGEHWANAIAVPYVVVDEVAQLRGGVEHLLGIDCHENAGVAQCKVYDLLWRVKRIDLNSFQINLFHFHKQYVLLPYIVLSFAPRETAPHIWFAPLSKG